MDDVHISCPFCRGETVVAGDPESGLDLEFNGDEGVLFLFNGDTCIGHFEVEYCPMCGRKLA